MQITFRTDAALHIGTGHVMRCLTLADALKGEGSHCSFVCRAHEGHLLDVIKSRGHAAIALPPDRKFGVKGSDSDLAHAEWLGTFWQSDAEATGAVLNSIQPDWLVVDHYALDARWEKTLRDACSNIMVIDDLADRRHDCDLLLDQNLGRKAEDYRSLVPDACQLLMGPQYALLRPEFAELRAESLARRQNPKLEKLLITLGGVDKDNVTGQVLDQLKTCVLPPSLEISVILGPHAPWLNQVRALAATMPWPTEVAVGVIDMAQRMVLADLCIGAAGSTSWERCCLGLPTILMVLAENQKQVARMLADQGAAIVIDQPKAMKHIIKNHFDLDSISKCLRSLSQNSALVTQGQGVFRIQDQGLDLR